MFGGGARKSGSGGGASAAPPPDLLASIRVSSRAEHVAREVSTYLSIHVWIVCVVESNNPYRE